MVKSIVRRAVSAAVICILVLSLLPAAALAATMSTKNFKTFDRDKNYYVLKNYDKKYLYRQYDYSRFVQNGQNVGCTATAEAIACSVTWGKQIKPDNKNYIAWGAGGAGWASSKWIKQTSEKDQFKKIGEQLQKGNAVIVRANNGHTVAAIGLRKKANVDKLAAKDILIADPATGATETLKNAQPNGYSYPGPSGSTYGWSLGVPDNSKKPTGSSSGGDSTTPAKDATISFSGIKAPNGGTLEYGKGYHLVGKVSAKDGKIAKIEARVTDRDGKECLKKSVTVNKTSYSLNDSDLDWAMTLGGLPAGRYALKYTATPSKGKAATTSCAFTVVLPSKWYSLAPKNAPKTRLDVQSGKKDDGTNVQIYASNKSDGQKWKLTHVGDGWYTLTAKNSGKALDVQGGNSASGTNVWQYSPNGTAAQKWYLQSAGNGYYVLLSNLDVKLALDVSGGKTSNGTNVQVYSRNNTDAQKWTVAAV